MFMFGISSMFKSILIKQSLIIYWERFPNTDFMPMSEHPFSQRTPTMFVGVVALRVDNGVPQLPQTQSEFFDQHPLHVQAILHATIIGLSKFVLFMLFVTEEKKNGLLKHLFITVTSFFQCGTPDANAPYILLMR